MAIIAALLSMLAIFSDLYARRIPNAWLLESITIGSGLIVFSWLQGASGSAWPALLGLLTGIISLLPFYIFRWMGAGDVKFFAVLGFLLGAKALLPIWTIASAIAGIHAVVILISRSWFTRATPVWAMAQTWIATSSFRQKISKARQGREGLPYAAWLGVGALVTIFNPELMHW